MRSFQNKKGVSLIAVLLFMLVATIAATATFKWLSSSNSSSGSRMAQQEAYQSSLAGLENARTWMTYHANDVGSLIKQYKDANKSKSASDDPIRIKLNNQLKSLTRSGQEYDVWLAGVNTEESTYKLKILSTGKARNGSVYSQVGIFNVDGLYQVKKPQEKVSREIEFDYAYFGASASMGGRTKAESIFINGDLSAKEFTITKNAVITGNLTSSDNHVSMDGNTCIGGNMSLDEEGFKLAGSLYVGGNITKMNTTPNSDPFGDMYVEGSVTFSQNGGGTFTFDNLTINGDLNLAKKKTTVNGNTCFGETTRINVNNAKSSDNQYFHANGNVWYPGSPSVISQIDANALRLGGTGFDAYVQGAGGSEGTYSISGGKFTSTADVHSSLPAEKPFSCAETIKNTCEQRIADAMTENACPDSKRGYQTKELLKVAGIFNSETALSSYENACAKGATKISELNSCYESASDADLYNGYLVYVGTGSKVASLLNQDNGGNTQFAHKFIIIATSSASFTKIKGTTSTGKVFLYLQAGGTNLAQGNDNIYNYFIFSNNDISSTSGDGSKTWTGAIYLSAKNCAKVGTFNDYMTLVYDAKFVKDLADNGIICNYDDPSCGPGGSIEGGSGTETSEETLDFGSADSYYVANAPQLSVSLETQYKSNESAPTGADASTDLKEDFIVLPRVIYLTTNPYGKLEDYYSVIPLNGLKEENLNGSVSCGNSDLLKNPIYDRTSSSATPLPSGAPIVCNYTASVNGQSQTVPFYIVVTGSSGNGPEVSFTESYKAMTKGGFYAVQVNVPAHDGNFKLKVTKPSGSDWTITPNSGNCGSNNECTFDVSSQGVVTLFNVTANTDNGTALFQLQGGEGYSVGSPSSLSLFVSTAVTVQRTDVEQATLSTYCTSNPGNCPSRDDWPNCSVADGVSWVRADNGIEGNNCTQGIANQEWSCSTAGSIRFTPIPEGNDCVIIIPENEIIEQSTLTTGETYTLHASAKARPLTFTFGFAGRDYADESITASVEGKPEITQTCYGRNGECSLEVFQGEQVNVTYGETKPENFNFWSCSGTDCPTDRPQTGKTYSVLVTNSTDKVIAHYNEKDEHCFFDEFKLSGTDCDANLDYCIGTNGKKWKVANSTDLTKINYQTGSISVKPNKMDKAGVTIMSTAVAGFEGTMKAQFQVPRVVRSAGAEIPETIRNSGIILRANETGSTHLLLSLYADEDGYLTARLCKQDGSGCITKLFDSPSGKLSISSSEAIVTLTITMTADGIELGAVSNASRFTSSSSDLRTAEFKYATDGFSTYQSSGEYLGIRLADPEFRLFDIGWYSKDYEADCWDTPPTVICSFKAAYPSGIVPIYDNVKGNYAKPWVGLSSWYDAAGCEVSYLYKGTDACGGTTYDYTECGSDGYDFSEDGLHGIVSGTDTSLAARAGVQNCSNLGEKDSYMEALGEKAFCGSFWVGKMEGCKTGIEYSYNGENNGAKIYTTANATENLRMTTLTIELQNSDNAEIEVYLISQDYDGTGEFTSKSFVTKANTVINVPVDSILDAAGFNPEKVSGVAIAIPGSASVTIQKVYTTCPNEVSLSCDKNLEYNASAHRWEYTVKVNNHTELASLETWGFSGNGLVMEPVPTTTGTADQKCEGNGSADTECHPSVNGMTATYSFYIDDYPYRDPKDYAFVVKLTDKDGVTYNDNSKYGCATNVITITGPSVECSVNAASKFVTEGLPEFRYSIDNCPACSYRISMFGTGEEIVLAQSTNESDPEGSISVSAENSNNHENSVEHPLAAGDYKFRIVSTDANMPFDDCEGEFTILSLTDPSASNCRIEDVNGQPTFKAQINPQNFGTSGAILAYADNIGNIIGTEQAISTSTTSFTQSLSSLTPNTYYLNLFIKGQNGEYAKFCEPSVEYVVREPLRFTDCPTSDTKLEGTSASLHISGCGEDETCTVSISPSIAASLSDGEISISGATEGSSYTINVARESDDATASCPITFKSEGPDPSDITVSSCYITLQNQTDAINTAYTETDITFHISGYSKDVEVDLTGIKPTWNGSKGKNEDAPFTDRFWIHGTKNEKTPATAAYDGTLYTYQILDKSGKLICSPKLTVKNPVGCSVSNPAPGPGDTFTMTGQYTGSGGKKFKYYDNGWKYVDPASGTFTYTFTAPTTPGTYEYCAYTENGSPTGTCCIEIPVAETERPELGCPDPATYSKDPKAKITFEPTSLLHCGAGCDYKIERKTDKYVMATSNNTKSYKVSNKSVDFYGDEVTGEVNYNFIVNNTVGADTCEFKVDYKKPEIECPSTSEFTVEPGATFTYPVSGNISHCSSNCTYVVEDSPSSQTGSYTGGNVSIQTSTTGSDETYYFYVKTNLASSEKCEITIHHTKPDVQCSGTLDADPSQNISITPTTLNNCGNGCSYKIVRSDDSHETATGSSVTGPTAISFNSDSDRSGTTPLYKLKVKDKAGQEDDCEFYVAYTKPYAACPTISGDKTPGDGFSYTPTITGCGNVGCNYEVTCSKSGGGSCTGSMPSSNSYSFINGSSISIPGQSAGTYTFNIKVTNQGGAYDDCNVTVNYVQPTYVCNCETYCGSKCADLKTSGNSIYWDGGCYFVKSFNFINGSGSYIVNGGSKNGYITSNDIPKADGGWYIEMPSSGSDYGSEVTLGDPDCTPAVIETCPGSQSGVDANSQVTITPEVSNCDGGSCSWEVLLGGSPVNGGDNYSGSGNLTFMGASDAGQKNYTFKVTKGRDSPVTCSFNVDYVAVAIPDKLLYCDWSDNKSSINIPSKIICNKGQGGNCDPQKLHCEGSFFYKEGDGPEQPFSNSNIDCRNGSSVTITRGSSARCSLLNWP